MANRQLSVKFDTEGFQAAINQMQAIGKAFDVVLLNAQNNIKIAQREIAAASNNGSMDQMAEAQKLLEQNTKIANRAIAASYRELGIKSSESLNNLRAQAVSAFEAIKISGTAQALDIGRAQDALTNKLKQLEAQLNSQNVNAYKLLGVQSRAELTEARQQIMDAYQTLKQGADSSRQSQEELGLAYRSMTEKIAAINQQLNQSAASNDLNAAYKLLGVRSEADLQIAVAQIRQAYETIREARGVGTEDEVAARKAMQSQLNAINDLSEAYNLLGIRNRDQLLATKQQVETAWASISVRNRLTGQELAYAYQSYLGKIQEIDKELNKTIAQRQVEDAYKLLGVRSEADLKKARDEIIQSYELIRNASGANSPDGLAALSARNSQVKAINSQLGIKDPAAELSNAYNMLGFRSKEELIKAQQEIKAAYDLIRESGLRNYRDIGLAAAAYQQQLREINQELNQTAKSRQRDDAFKLLGIRSEADLIQARQEIRSAFDAIDRSTEKTANDVRRAREAMGEMLAQINSELAKTSAPPKGVGDAFNLLGVRSEAELLKARDEILQAYQMIADAAAKLQTTMSVDDIKAQFGNKFAEVKNALGITARSWNDLATIYNQQLASQPGSATNRDQEAAMRAMAERIKNINSELGIKDETKQLGDAYRSLGFRSEAELNKAIQEIAAAYDLIRSKVGQLGVTQRDVELAADALQKKIKQLANELKSVQERGVSDAYKLLGVRSEADLNQAIQEIEQAFQTIANSKNKSNSDMIRAEEAMLSKVKQLRAEIARTGTPPTNVNDAYKLLGVRSEAEINKAKNDIRNAFNEIQQAGSRRDITVAQDALIAKLKQLDAELAGTAVKTNILKSSIDSLAVALKMQLTFAISGMLLSLPASIGQLITGFADFERQMSTLKAVSESTKGELAAVRDEIERLGRSTSKTPEDIAKLSVELARAGYKSGEITSALNGIVKASEAAGEDLTQVGQIITGVLKAYSLPASESGRIADLLTQTANKAAVSVVDLGESLKYVGTAAAGSNQKVEDVLVVLGLMGNVMLKGGQAGRNYAQTLDKMKLSSAAVSDELIVSSRGMETAGEAMKRLGVSFRDSNGQIRPFLDILPELKKKMEALPQQDQDVISRVLFGVEGGRAIQTTLRATGKDIDYLVKALKEADGVADKTSKTINNDLKGSFNSLGGSAQVLSNQIVSQVAPAIKGAIDGIIKIVNTLSTNVSTLIGILSGLAVSGVTGLVINAVRALAVAFAALIVQIQAAGGAVAFFRGGLIALVSPTNVAVATIGILAGTLIKFSMDAQQARESALSLGSALDALAMRKDKTALIDLDDKERKAREGLGGIDRELERKKAQVAASGTGWDWLPGNEFSRTETEREIKRLEAEKQDAIAELQRIPSVRQQILDNQSGKNKPASDFATRNPTVGAPLPPPTPDKAKTTSARSASQSKKEEEYYEFPVARPTSGPVSSPYGMRTRNGKTRLHDGIDYAPPAGTPVIAPLPGKVTKVGFEAGGAGNYVTIETIDKAGKKIEQIFMHLSKVLVGVGETVQQKDTIGKVGSTGDSTGPHLHWRTKINGQSVNPTAFEKMKFTLPSGAGKPSDYLREADKNEEKQQDDIRKEKRKQQDDIRKEKIRSFLSESGQIIDTEKSKILEQSQQKIYDLKVQSLKADEMDRSSLEQEIKLQELLTNFQVKELELIGKQQQTEGEISILEANKVALNNEEKNRLRELYAERKKITKELELANKESERAITLQQLESNNAREKAVERLRGELEVILEKVIPKKNLTEIEKNLNEVVVSVLKERDTLNKKLQEASKLSDQISFDKITSALKELDQQLPNFLSLQLRDSNKTITADSRIPNSELKTYRDDGLKRKEAEIALEIKYRDLRIGTEALLAAARNTGNQKLIADYEKLLALINQQGAAQLKQIQAQGDILNNVVETAKEAFASGLSQLFTDLITGTKNLEDSFKSFASSILKAIADMAIQAAARGVIKMVLGAGFADGGYVSGAGTGRSDSIPARLSNGEFVMSANSVKHWGVGLLDNLNNRRMPNLAFESPSYNGGSNVSRSATIVMNVNTPDANSFRRSETQMGRDAGEQLRRSMQRNG
jgi:TP901 family phage tail tape measure protein